MTNSASLRRLIFTALLAALCYVATVMFRIPTLTGGYVNLGDGFVLLAGFLLGPWFGALAGGIGSAIADLLAGYSMYAPGTFVAKAVTALVAGLLFLLLRRHTKLPCAASAVMAGVFGEVCMVFLYFCYEATVLGFGLGAAVEIPGNCMQGAAGVAVGALLATALLQIPYIQKTMRGLTHAN